MEGYGWLVFIAMVGGYWAVEWQAKRSRAKQSDTGAQTPPVAPPQSSSPPKQLSLQDQIAATKASVRSDFDQTQVELDRAAKLAEHRKHIEKVSEELKKAGADHDLDDFIENTRNFGHWAKSGHLSYLSEYGIAITGAKERGPDKDDRSYGYTFNIEDREWTVRFAETGYSWVDTSSQNGTFSIMRGEDVVFKTSMSQDTDREWSRWEVSLYFVEAIQGLDWLHDVIRLNEVVKIKHEAVTRQKTREEAAERAAALRLRD